LAQTANLYDICDPVILNDSPTTEPGRNFALIYRTLAGNPFLKHLLLRYCRHPDIPMHAVQPYQDVIRAALHATVDDWRNPSWIRNTMMPVARLLDRVERQKWQQRERLERIETQPEPVSIDRVIRETTADVLREWGRDPRDPYFPVAAQIVLTGDDHMDGENFLDVLCGMGSFTNQNMCLMMYLIRAFLMKNPRQRRWIREPFVGISEPMRNRLSWIWHRTAFYDGFFFEQISNRLRHAPLKKSEREQILGILENLVRFIVVESREWLTSPNQGIKFPAITCLPHCDGKVHPCRLSKRDWETKKLLGFGDYVPDTDTTFVGLSVARNWLDLIKVLGISADPTLVNECELFLSHPWVGIIHELQVGGRYNSNPPTIHISRPLDYYGAIPIWFDKPFVKPGGETIREVLGNEICPGHNMDIFNSILLNRQRWSALEGENLEVVQRLLEFHHRAFTSGNFRMEPSFIYYLPEIYIYYTGRMYDTFLDIEVDERALLDPSGKIEEIRRIAMAYIKDEMIGATLNVFDAAIALSALIQLRYPSKDDGVVAIALDVLIKGLGEGGRSHPYRAYEWNRMRHPTRMIIGSEITTSLFVMNAAVDARRFLFGESMK
jgi:hypothetical protein